MYLWRSLNSIIVRVFGFFRLRMGTTDRQTDVLDYPYKKLDYFWKFSAEVLQLETVPNLSISRGCRVKECIRHKVVTLGQKSRKIWLGPFIYWCEKAVGYL